MKIGVTGTTGYIGEYFVKLALAEGHEIFSLSRRRPAVEASEWIPYQLSSSSLPQLPADTDVVLHLATDTSSNTKSNVAQEIAAAELLINAARGVGAKFIFVSSQTARPDAPSAYGQTKWRIEQIVLAAGGCVVRPGQVYGGQARGLFGQLVDTVRGLPILPAFLPPPRVQPIHVVDLTRGLLAIAESADRQSNILCLGSHESISFTDFLRAIARSRLRRSRFFFPIPTKIVSVFIRLMGTHSNLARLRSLFDLPKMDTEPHLGRLGLCLRPLNSGMHVSGCVDRRRLFLEGRAVLTYVLRARPRSALLRRYVRAIEKLRGGKALSLPKLFLWWPILLALIDDSGCNKTTWREEFVWRLDTATLLAEATTLGARRFLGLGEPHGFLKSAFGAIRAIVAEAVWRMLSALMAPFLGVFLPRSLEERQ